MFTTSDTIVAIATPAGRGGIGVVRVAGPEAGRIAQRLTGRKTPYPPRRATFARIIEPPEGSAKTLRRAEILDQVIVTAFAAPHSYTGDDVVELAAHGSPVLLNRIVQLAMAGGARLAEPGEFTLRAYLNGRMDLIQAEAVADLVNAVTPLQARVAMDQLEGTLTGAIGAIDAALFDLTARLEASLDFPDEGFHFISRDQVAGELKRIDDQVDALIRSGRIGRVVREGRTVVITGRPNAGKSSLFNALLGAARAIVTEIPGTTRDVLTERVDLDGLDITLVDTAGLREARDAIEAEGIARARQAQQVAALTIVVVDGSVPGFDGERELALASTSPRIVAVTKSDLPRRFTRTDELRRGCEAIVDVSAVTGEGVDALRSAIVEALTGAEQLRDPPRISNTRHVALLENAQALLTRAREALEAGATEELVLVDLAAARGTLEELTGRRTAEDLLGHIFANFCVGK